MQVRPFRLRKTPDIQTNFLRERNIGIMNRFCRLAPDYCQPFIGRAYKVLVGGQWLIVDPADSTLPDHVVEAIGEAYYNSSFAKMPIAQWRKPSFSSIHQVSAYLDLLEAACFR